MMVVALFIKWGESLFRELQVFPPSFHRRRITEAGEARIRHMYAVMHDVGLLSYRVFGLLPFLAA